jgi:hypothetical protein
MGKQINLGAKPDIYIDFTPDTDDYVVVEGLADCIVVAVVYLDQNGVKQGVIGHFSSQAYDKDDTERAEEFKRFINKYANSNHIFSISFCTNYPEHKVQTIEKITTKLDPNKKYGEKIKVSCPSPKKADYITIYYFIKSNKFHSQYYSGWEEVAELGDGDMAVYDPKHKSSSNKKACVIL